MEINTLKEKFLNIFGRDSEKIYVFFAPGRVNLIGEHTDYNGGYVLPCALSFGTYLLIRKTGKDEIRLRTTNFDAKADIPLKDMQEKHTVQWANYPLGVMDQFMKTGISLTGLEMLFSGEIPYGAGLSSSASVEMVTAVALNDIFAAGIDRIDLIKMSQKAENEFVGVNCGIMDQFAVGKAKKDHAMFLDCNTLDYEQVPLNLGDYRLVIANTNKKRGLADSKYNERVQECAQALAYLNPDNKFKNMSDIDLQLFDELKKNIPEQRILQRARHVISENNRVLKSVEALRAGDLESFGMLMKMSHDSLRDDYEVTGPELDVMVSEACKIDGVAGARMTGAGFGGCTVNLMHRDQTNEFTSRVGTAYLKKTGLEPGFYFPETADGAHHVC